MTSTMSFTVIYLTRMKYPLNYMDCFRLAFAFPKHSTQPNRQCPNATKTYNEKKYIKKFTQNEKCRDEKNGSRFVKSNWINVFQLERESKRMERERTKKSYWVFFRFIYDALGLSNSSACFVNRWFPDGEKKTTNFDREECERQLHWLGSFFLN